MGMGHGDEHGTRDGTETETDKTVVGTYILLLLGYGMVWYGTAPLFCAWSSTLYMCICIYRLPTVGTVGTVGPALMYCTGLDLLHMYNSSTHTSTYIC